MSTDTVTVHLNGKTETVPAGTSALETICSAGFDMVRVAVDIDGKVIPKAELKDFILKGGEYIEVVSFVGGG